MVGSSVALDPMNPKNNWPLILSPKPDHSSEDRNHFYCQMVRANELRRFLREFILGLGNLADKALDALGLPCAPGPSTQVSQVQSLLCRNIPHGPRKRVYRA